MTTQDIDLLLHDAMKSAPTDTSDESEEDRLEREDHDDPNYTPPESKKAKSPKTKNTKSTKSKKSKKTKKTKKSKKSKKPKRSRSPSPLSADAFSDYSEAWSDHPPSSSTHIVSHRKRSRDDRDDSGRALKRRRHAHYYAPQPFAPQTFIVQTFRDLVSVFRESLVEDRRVLLAEVRQTAQDRKALLEEVRQTVQAGLHSGAKQLNIGNVELGQSSFLACLRALRTDRGVLPFLPVTMHDGTAAVVVYPQAVIKVWGRLFNYEDRRSLLLKDAGSHIARALGECIGLTPTGDDYKKAQAIFRDLDRAAWPMPGARALRGSRACKNNMLFYEQGEFFRLLAAQTPPEEDSSARRITSYLNKLEQRAVQLTPALSDALSKLSDRPGTAFHFLQGRLQSVAQPEPLDESPPVTPRQE